MANLTFGKKIAGGFALALTMMLVIGGVAYRSTNLLIETSERVAHTQAVLENLSQLLSALQDLETGQRGYVITGDEGFLEPFTSGRARIYPLLDAVRSLTLDNPRQQSRIDQLRPIVDGIIEAHVHTNDVRKADGFDAAQSLVRSGEGKRRMDEARGVIGEMVNEERGLLKQRDETAQISAATAKGTILFGSLFAVLITALVGLLITRSLAMQIGVAIQHLHSSSSELQAAANQQASSSKEQTTVVNEVTTTLKELSASSRQISESAQRVTRTAEETLAAAQAGNVSVERGREAMVGMQRQVEVIVTNIVDLGKKSQHIGAVLDIIAELADQTNILAINATIESAGAGEAGKRFGVVADEIRKLADRVGGTTKETRTLVEQIRAAANSSVMATEGGAKAVELGARQFAEVAASFRRIGEMVQASTDASREIELSTKQQTSAAEQVNGAMANVAQGARESEVSTRQTLQTSTELASLSRNLSLLIRAESARPRGV